MSLIAESCPKCNSLDFAIARDMKATRLCRCGHTWLPPSKREAELLEKIDALEADLAEVTRELRHSREYVKSLQDKIDALFQACSMVSLERDRLKERVAKLREALGKIGQDDWRYHEVAQQALAADDEMEKK